MRQWGVGYGKQRYGRSGIGSRGDDRVFAGTRLVGHDDGHGGDITDALDTYSFGGSVE